jgi:CDGSH-type Zn-finger protein/uncharacterized Fe-S cluster protein YjdI
MLHREPACMPKETVTGRDVRVVFEAQRCIHSRHCVLDRPDVFVPNVAGDWIHPDLASPAEVAELAHNCPSGAIQYESVAAGVAAERPPRVNTLRVRENGPLAVHAELRVQGASDGCRATLCRCGASANKPWCDGAHARAGFVASGEPATQESTPLAVRDGPLEVLPVRDGPLRLKGNLELVSGTGRTLNRTSESWLCRCGQSRNKPYCDGSHKAAGFSAPG